MGHARNERDARNARTRDEIDARLDARAARDERRRQEDRRARTTCAYDAIGEPCACEGTLADAIMSDLFGW